MRIEVANSEGLAKQVNDLKAALTNAQGGGTTYETLIARADSALATSEATSSVTRSTLDNAAPALMAAQAALGTGHGWAIVFSADRTEKAAEPELKKAAALSLGSPLLYLRQGWYRGALPF